MSDHDANFQDQDALLGAIFLAESDNSVPSSEPDEIEATIGVDPQTAAPSHLNSDALEAEIAFEDQPDTRDPLSFEEIMDLDQIVEEASMFQTAAGAASDPQTAIDTGGNGIFVPYESPELFAGLEAIGALAPV